VALRRLFIAAALTTDVRHALAARFDQIAIPGRRVEPANWHVTLRFIGEVDEDIVDRLRFSLDQFDLGDRFRIRWGSLGAFPRAAKATVLWLGLRRGAVELAALESAVDSAVVSAGVTGEERPFRPHLTVSRIRPPQDVTGLVETVDPGEVSMPVERLLLMESHLGRGGVRYEQVDSFELG